MKSPRRLLVLAASFSFIGLQHGGAALGRDITGDGIIAEHKAPLLKRSTQMEAGAPSSHAHSAQAAAKGAAHAAAAKPAPAAKSQSKSAVAKTPLSGKAEAAASGKPAAKAAPAATKSETSANAGSVKNTDSSAKTSAAASHAQSPAAGATPGGASTAKGGANAAPAASAKPAASAAAGGKPGSPAATNAPGAARPGASQSSSASSARAGAANGGAVQNGASSPSSLSAGGANQPPGASSAMPQVAPPRAEMHATAGASAPKAAPARTEHETLMPDYDTEGGAPLPGSTPPPQAQRSQVKPAFKNAAAKDYPDGRGRNVHFPQGDLSFADEVATFQKGEPAAAGEYSNAKNLLGPPDYKGPGDASPCVLTLGCHGQVVLRFTDNVLVDVPGADLFVFEVGEDEEPTELSISEDGRKWIDIGKISGSTAAVDIKPFVMPGEVFHFVRLRDLGTHCEGDYPGADIDAVGAIGSAVKLSLKSSVLFDYKETSIKPGAKASLHDIAWEIKRYPKARIVVEGHTDDVGDDDYNQKLSEGRAKAVKEYLLQNEGLAGFKIETKGYGKTRPIAPNTTEAGREQNRRVEILVLPEQAAEQSAPLQESHAPAQ
jgi:outer membrane protein OmpA-like peptidoglycan-associated protein